MVESVVTTNGLFKVGVIVLGAAAFIPAIHDGIANIIGNITHPKMSDDDLFERFVIDKLREQYKDFVDNEQCRQQIARLKNFYDYAHFSGMPLPDSCRRKD